MKLNYAISILCLMLTACGASKHSNVKKPGTDAASKPMELIPIKYPAAIVYEGGLGEDMWELKDVKASWRLYICMTATETPLTGHVHVDMEKLGQPTAIQKATRTYEDGRIEELQYRLNDFDLNFSYTSFLMDYPDFSHGYAWGEAEITVKGVMNFQPKEGYGNDFENHFSRGTLASQVSNVYDTDKPGQKTYIRSWLQRLTADKAANRLSPITPCEKADQPIVFEVGDQITKL